MIIASLTKQAKHKIMTTTDSYKKRQTGDKIDKKHIRVQYDPIFHQNASHIVIDFKDTLDL